MNPVEKTRAGWQFVIPGCEAAAGSRPDAPEYSQDGRQFVMPGAEKLSDRDLLQRAADAPIRPRRGQRPLPASGLFRRGSE